LFWFFADVADVTGGTARIRARGSSAPPSSEPRATDTSAVLKDGSITATAIRNFGDCDGMPGDGP